MIVTFYSFKGGVGRSMALASVAYLLAERGLRVLAIDFDLEAPGLERYFFDEAEARRVRQDPGLIDLLTAYKRALTNEDDFRRAEFRDWWRYVQSAAPSVAGGGCVDLVTAGRREPQERFADYALAVRTFDWQAFFHDWKGERFFDWLRGELTHGGARGYDLVLVDSRTGITEMGGVCAYQLADTALMLCAANDQNIEGTLRVARDFRSEATLALRRGRELQILVIPARLEANNPRRDDFLRSFERTFRRDEFLPKQLYELGLDYTALALPYDPEFAVIERLVGEGARTASGQAALQTFARLADALVLLATQPGRLHELQADTRARLQGLPGAAPAAQAQVADPTRPGAGFDFFLDDAALPEPAARRRLREGLAREQLRVAGADDALLPGASWAMALQTQLAASGGLVLLVGDEPLSPQRQHLVDSARQRGLPVLPVLRHPSPEAGVEPERWTRWQGLRGPELADVLMMQLMVYDTEPEAWPQRIAHAWRLLRPPEGPTAAEATPTEPYPGARAFTESEAPLFFGREAEARLWAPQVAAAPLTLLLGAAGVGKTSFVQAALIPALRRSADAWPAPALQRVRTVDAAQLEADPRLLQPADGGAELWVVDHVDSLAGGAGPDARRRRIGAVQAALEAAGPDTRVLLVLRDAWADADLQAARRAWGLAAEPPPLQLLLQPLPAEALVRAVERPAGRLGHVVEPGLAALLQGQAGAPAGALARVAALLPQLWQQRRRGWLTGAALEAAGGVAGHVAQAWAGWLATRSDAERMAVQALVRTLSALDAGMRPVAVPMAWERVRSILAVPAEVDLVALRDALADARLLELWRERPEAGAAAPFGTGELMLALPLAQPALCGPEHAASADPAFVAFMLWRAEFASFVTAWERAGRIDSATLAEQALLDAESRAYRHWDLLTEPERALIARSHELRRDAEERQRQLERERGESEALRQSRDDALQARRDALRQRRYALWAASLAVLLAVGAVVLARKSDRQAQAVVAARDTAAAFLADAYADADPTAAALTLRDVVAEGRATASARALRFRVIGPLLSRALLHGHTDLVNHAAFSPDGTRVATASADRTARLWHSDGRAIATLAGHTAWIYHASFSADGRTVLTASRDHTARLWDSDGQPLAVLKGHGGWVYHAAFSPDGQRLATASDDGTARLWSREGRTLAVLRGHTDAVRQVLFAPDGALLATLSDDRTARLWSADGRPLATLAGHADWLTHAAWSPDGRLLATVSEDRSVRLWSRDGKLLATLAGHTGPVTHVAFSPDGERLLTASDDRTARLWSRDGDALATLQGHEGPLASAVFSADGQWLLTASDDRSARLWTRDATPVAVLRGHAKAVRHAAFAAQGGLVVTASDDRSARLWRVDGGVAALLAGHTGALRHAAFSPQGDAIVTTSDDRNARLWTADGRARAELRGHGGGVRHAAWAADGRRLVTASTDRSARVWSADGQALAVLVGHLGSVLHVAVDGDRVATASADGTARLWALDGRHLATMSGHERAVVQVAFAPGGGPIATASNDHSARLWTSDGRALATLSGHTQRLTHLAWAPDGARLATASADRSARLWAADGRSLGVLAGHGEAVLHVAFSPDGQSIVTTSGDGSARLWNADGSLRTALTGHGGAVLHAAWAADSRSLVTTGADGSARWWTRDGGALATLGRGAADGTLATPPAQAAAQAAFSPDGARLLLHQGGPTAELWPVSEAAFLSRLRLVAKPCHTLAERRRAYPDEDRAASEAAVQRCNQAAASKAPDS